MIEQQVRNLPIDLVFSIGSLPIISNPNSKNFESIYFFFEFRVEIFSKNDGIFFIDSFPAVCWLCCIKRPRHGFQPDG